MKKNLLIAVAFVFTLANVNAQTEKGNFMFSGGSSFSFTSANAQTEFNGEQVGDDLKTSLFTLNPSAGYFVMDNLAVELEFAFTSTKTDDGAGDVTTSSLAALPGARYYFDAGDKFKPFVGVNAGIISTSSGDEDVLKSNGFTFGGKAGVAYFLNENVSLDFLVRYINSNQKNKADDNLETKNSNIALGFGFSIFI